MKKTCVRVSGGALILCSLAIALLIGVNDNVLAIEEILTFGDSGHSVTGLWNPNNTGLNEHWEAPGADAGSTSTWEFIDLANADYYVSTLWTATANRTMQATYSISDGGGDIVIDQQDPARDFTFAGQSWKRLTPTPVSISDGTLSVTVSDLDPTLFLMSDSILISDQFDPSPPPPPPATFNGDLIAYQVNAPQGGIQDFGGSVGMDFVVESPIVVSALGAFDADQDGMNLDITVDLWSRDDAGTPDAADDTGVAILATEVFTSNDPGTLVGGSRLKSLDTPLVLPAGAYTINAHGYGAGELLANSGVGGGFFIDRQLNDGGLLSFVGTSRFCFQDGPCTDFPPTPDGGPEDRYAAGTFAFSPVPEPGVLTLLAVGLLTLVLVRRRVR